MDISRRLVLGGALASPLLLSAAGCSPTRSGDDGVGAVVIRNAHTVLTMDPGLGEIRDGDILINAGTIEAVGPDLSAPGVREIDATDLVAIPGLVDTHWHMWNSIARGFGSSSAGGFSATMQRLSPLFTPEDSAAGVRLALAEAIDSGITSVHNWAHNIRSGEHADAEIAAMRTSGIRGRFSYGYPQDEKSYFPMDLDHLEATASRWEPGLLTLGICARGPDRSSPAVWRQEWSAARSLGIPVTTHQSSTPAEARRGGVRALADGGGLGPDVQLVHLTAASPDDLGRIADAGAAVSISPWSELQVGYGIPPIMQMRDAGIRMGLSVDNTVLSGQADMFSVMRITADLAAGVTREQTAVPDDTVLAWATSTGAESLGLADTVGTLAPGRRADIVLVRTDALSNSPVRDATALLVRAARPSDVDFVMIDGVIHKRDGRLVHVDADAVVADAAERISRIRQGADV